MTCTELASIVTTEDNSFLVWGSRPIIRSPLLKLLTQHTSRSSFASESRTKSSETASQKERSNSLQREESDVFDDEKLPQVGSGILISPASCELGTSFQSVSSGHLASNESTPERKPSSTDSVATKTPSKDPSNESLNPKFTVGTGSGSKEKLVSGHMRRYSSLNLSDTPHIMHTCSSSKDYVDKVNSLLQELNLHAELDRNQGVSGSMSRQRESVGSIYPKEQQQQQQGFKANKRSNSSELVMMDGIIMKPTSIDLVGRSGLLSTFSVQGLMNARLEGISCFGCNVVILIEARVLLEAEGKDGVRPRVSVTSKLVKQPRLILSRRLTEKGVSRRYVVMCGELRKPLLLIHLQAKD